MNCQELMEKADYEYQKSIQDFTQIHSQVIELDKTMISPMALPEIPIPSIQPLVYKMKVLKASVY